MKEERRRHPRSAPARGLTIRCTSPDTPGRASDSYNFATRVVDVSARGICVVTVGRMRRGIPVAVEMVVPSTLTRFKSRATVRWSTTLESKGRVAHVTGLSFDRTFVAALPRKREEPAQGRASRAPAPAGPDPQRAHRRFSAEPVEIVCLPRGFLRALGLSSNAGKKLKDLSRGGAQILCSRKLEPGDRVDLRLEFKNLATTVEAEGEVRWCKRDTSSLEPRYFAGVVFRKLPPNSNASLNAVERAFLGS